MLCAALAASLWRAPVPWVHSHDALASENAGGPSLLWHLQHFHLAGGLVGNLGWHVHLTFPWNVLYEPKCDEDADAPKPRCVYEMPFVISQGISVADAGPSTSFQPFDSVFDVLPPLGVLTAVTPFCAALHFLQGDPPGVSLRAWICVARC